jgi:hypothetical protein
LRTIRITSSAAVPFAGNVIGTTTLAVAESAPSGADAATGLACDADFGTSRGFTVS